MTAELSNHEQSNTASIRVEYVVQETDTASRWGNVGLDVLSTPAILGHVEQVCAVHMGTNLEPHQMSVGVTVQMKHRGPAELGQVVIIEVAPIPADKGVQFKFSVTDPAGRRIADGTHGRAIIDRDAFLRDLRTPQRHPAGGVP